MIRSIVILSMILLKLSFISLLAVNQTPILKGVILGEGADEKIEFANVILLSKDSVYYSGCTTDSLGVFLFKNITPDDYILKVSYTGYSPRLVKQTIKDGLNDIGNIYLHPNGSMLKEVTVSARQVKYKTENGKVITNVASTDLRTIGSAYDVLENVPGLTLNDDNLNVFGKGEPIIYIGNRKIIDKKELEKYRSTDIKSIELINNPSAKYAADGRSVLIINLNKTTDENMALQATAQYKQGKYANTSDLINFSLKTNRVNIFSSYMYSYQKNHVENTTDYTISSEKTWLQEISVPYTFQYNYHAITAGMDWDVDKNQVLGVQYQGNFLLMKTKMDGYQNLLENTILLDSIHTLTDMRNQSKQHLVNLFYYNNISDKFKIDITTDYLHNTAPSKQATDETTLTSGRRMLDIDSYSKFDMFTARTTANYKLNTSNNIEFGLDYSNIKGKGHYIENKDLIEKNLYSTTENKSGAFLSYSSQLKGMNYNLGIRYEYSKYSTEENGKEDLLTKEHNFFPYFSLSKTIRDISMNLSFSKKIRRPSFSELNSNSIYVNKYLTQKGDPNLKAEDIYTISYLLGYKILNVNLGYTYIKNPISTDFVQEYKGSPTSLMRFTNYPKFQKLELFSTINNSIGIWRQTYSVGITQPIFNIRYLDNISNRNKTNIYLSLNNDFKLFGDLISSVNFSMNTDNDYYITRSEGQKRLDLRLRKPFLKNKLNASIYIRDLFNWEEEQTATYVDQFKYKEKRNRNNRYILLSLQFNFSDIKSKYRGKNVSSDDLKRF